MSGTYRAQTGSPRTSLHGEGLRVSWGGTRVTRLARVTCNEQRVNIFVFCEGKRSMKPLYNAEVKACHFARNSPFTGIHPFLIAESSLFTVLRKHCVKLRTTCLLDFVHRLGWNIKYKNIKTTTFRKMALLPSSGDAWDGRRAIFRDVVVFIFLYFVFYPRRWTKSKRQVVLSVIYHRQNLSEFIA